ncbi:Nuclear transcription factor Y subunit B-5 [Morus notabilis]|uniref:Nuclear transcription factor Y subunit B-5 n=1 Tax=Morus notabilis TaxID=981085 RepID=W9QWP6_9ROSA|nr:nuclear transcription factor Y subunit B-5 [Morus notabilis]EXB40815.1 Nuclear transcription factor Y subunit B-5 [Morus notabilis]
MVDNNFGINTSERDHHHHHDKGFNYKYTAAGSASTSCEDIGVIKEQDRLLPIANVGRIMKQILPPNAKISKEAKETMQECVSEFISFVTGEASDKCHKEKRKTVNGDDICWGLATLGFDDYAEPLKRYLHRYREIEGEKSSAHQNNKAASSTNHEEIKINEISNNYGGHEVVLENDHEDIVPNSRTFNFNVVDERSKSSFQKRF